MRVALEALTIDEADFGTALGNFLFRWEGPLREAGVRPVWRLDVVEESHPVSPHVALQVLRILQEALTNILKHAHATEVSVEVRGTTSELSIRVAIHGDHASEMRWLQNGMEVTSSDGTGSGHGFYPIPAGTEEVSVDLGGGPGEANVAVDQAG